MNNKGDIEHLMMQCLNEIHDSKFIPAQTLITLRVDYDEFEPTTSYRGFIVELGGSYKAIYRFKGCCIRHDLINAQNFIDYVCDNRFENSGFETTVMYSSSVDHFFMDLRGWGQGI